MNIKRPQNFVAKAMWAGITVFMILNATSSAQFTGNSQTNIINGVTNNWPGLYFVGRGYSFDELQAINGGYLTVSSDVVVGYNGGSGNSLVISDGSTVMDNPSGVIGWSANNNSVLVSGTGSAWNNQNEFYVGYNGGSGNSLVISSGGAVTNGIGYAGFNANNNSVLVSGTGSVWNTTAIYVGYYPCSSNSLVISDGGRAVSATGYVGNIASNNSVLVSGSGSVWSNAADISVGENTGNGNSLIISNGGAVVDATGRSGNFSDNNSVLVTGNGSAWKNQSNLYIGHMGAGNTLVISAGGTVRNVAGYVGNFANNNSVLVSGTGSVWNNQTDLSIGLWGGSSNSLVISHGGTVANANGYIGFVAANNNSVLVTGSGSTWSNQANLSVGIGNDSGNSLIVSFGGTVVASSITVFPANSVTLNGGNLIASNGVVISQNAVLKGTGTIFANLTLAGTLSPGNSAGAITNFGNLTLQTSAVLDMQLGGTMQGTEYDFILVTNGVVTLDGLLRVSFINGFTSSVSSNDTFVLLQSNSPLGGSFTNVIGGYVTTAGGEGTFYVDYGNNAVTLSGYQAAVPEPSALALCAVALLTLLAARRRNGISRT